MKPLLKLPDEIRRRQDVLAQYRSITGDLKALGNDIRQDGAYTKDHRRRFELLQQRRGEISRNEPTDTPDREFLRKLQHEVSEEMPSTGFFVPEE